MELANFSSDRGNRVRLRQYSNNDSSHHLCEARLIIHSYNSHAVVTVNHGPKFQKIISFWFTDSTKCFRMIANATAQVLIELHVQQQKQQLTSEKKNIRQRLADLAHAPATTVATI
jgi:hypothetical protein